MLNLNDIFQDRNNAGDCFSGEYVSIVNHIFSRLQSDNNLDEQQNIVCDAPSHETKIIIKIKEDLVRCIWYGLHFKNDLLLTEDGTRIEILSPGWWNVEDGPDFNHAEILFSGKGLEKGDVEIHVNANDWNKHGHNLQDTYNNVCLHVVLWNEGETHFVYSKNGSRIPQLALHQYLNTELDELFETIDVKEYPENINTNAGLCQKSFTDNELNKKSLGLFLDYAGDERMLSKAQRYNKSLKTGTFEQILYEALMETLGYKNNKDQFLRLANVLPFKDLQEIVPIDMDYNDKVLYIQSAFYGMAGLLPCQLRKKDQNSFDQDSSDYIKKLENLWDSEIYIRLNKQPLDGNIWQFSKSRPTNFPTRRLAAMSHLVTKSLNNGLVALFMEIFEKTESYQDRNKNCKAVKKGIESIFLEIFDDYWSFYYTFGGKRSTAAERLIGKDRVSEILINNIIPILLLYAKNNENIDLEKRLHFVYQTHPKLSSNYITKFMANRIFGHEKDSTEIVYNARRQQGLHQIFKDFCDSDNFLCKECAMYLIMRN